MRIMRWALAFVAATTSLALADSANLRVVTERSFPEGWSEPEVTTGDGAGSYAPSIPSGFSTRDVGTVLDVGGSTVHTSGRISDPEVSRARIAYRYRLLLPGDIAVTLTPGVWKDLGADAVRLTRLASGDFALQYRNSGRILRLQGRPAAATAPRTVAPD
jgi:hypothetical protein